MMEIRLSKLKEVIDEIAENALSEATLKLAQFKGNIANLNSTDIIDSFGGDRVNEVANYYRGIIATADTDMAHAVELLLKERVRDILRSAQRCSKGQSIDSDILENIIAAEMDAPTKSKDSVFQTMMFLGWVNRISQELGLDMMSIREKADSIKDVDKISAADLKNLVKKALVDSAKDPEKLANSFIYFIKKEKDTREFADRNLFVKNPLMLALYDFFNEKNVKQPSKVIDKISDELGKAFEAKYKIFSFMYDSPSR